MPEPITNVSAGTTTISGHTGQSRKRSPGIGGSADPLDTKVNKKESRIAALQRTAGNPLPKFENLVVARPFKMSRFRHSMETSGPLQTSRHNE